MDFVFKWQEQYLLTTAEHLLYIALHCTVRFCLAEFDLKSSNTCLVCVLFCSWQWLADPGTTPGSAWRWASSTAALSVASQNWVQLSREATQPIHVWQSYRVSTMMFIAATASPAPGLGLCFMRQSQVTACHRLLALKTSASKKKRRK